MWTVSTALKRGVTVSALNINLTHDCNPRQTFDVGEICRFKTFVIVIEGNFGGTTNGCNTLII
jgi:hypothetical protein